jgi:hypothetical protein
LRYPKKRHCGDGGSQRLKLDVRVTLVDVHGLVPDQFHSDIRRDPEISQTAGE